MNLKILESNRNIKSKVYLYPNIKIIDFKLKKSKILGSWNENKVAGFVIFCQYLFF